MTRPFIGVNGARDREDDESPVPETPAPQRVETRERTVGAVARDIYHEWTKPYFGAVPYLTAMMQEDYGFDGRTSVVLYFLSNASTFRGGNAAALKKELKGICGIK